MARLPRSDSRAGAGGAPPANASPPPRLLDQVRQACAIRHLSRRTADAYVAWIRRFILFHHKRHPADMREPEVAAFLSWLAEHRRVSASTQNQALNALLFLYRTVLRRELGSITGVARTRTPSLLPVVLSRDEVRAVLAHLRGTPRLLVSLLYGAGLRLHECLELRTKDVDLDRNQITIRQGKGLKDRATILPSLVKPEVILHLERVRELHRRDLQARSATPSQPTCSRTATTSVRSRNSSGTRTSARR